MRKFKQKIAKGKWTTFPEDDEVQVLIRPFSLFNLTKIPTEVDVDFTQFMDIYNYCLLDWKGIQDNQGNDLKCNDDNKKLVFDFDQELVLFVVNECSKLRQDVLSGKAIKNLSTSQPGETKQQEK